MEAAHPKDLRMNGIRPDGAAALAKALMNNRRPISNFWYGFNEFKCIHAKIVKSGI
jgi:hypothetical protein